MKLNKKWLILALALVTIILIIILNLRIVNVYGTINRVGGAYALEAEVINCEITSESYPIINSYLITQYEDYKLLINGLLLFNYLTVQSINETYDPKIACYEVHKQDINPEPLNYTVQANKSSLIEYDITNHQDNRLFYECTLTINCTFVRDFFTGYLDPEEVHKVRFNITCSQGVHEASIKTVFADELVNYHTVTDDLIITSN